MYDPVSEGESFAKDLWFASFYLSGINVSDLLKLKVKDYNQGMISFIRTKTQGSRRSDLSPIILPVNEIILKFFNRYGNPEGAPNDFILSFLSPEMNGKQIHDKVHGVNKRARKHMNRIALKLDLPENLSMQWARHTYAKQAINLGQTMEFVGNSLGHSDIKTTQAYFSGFESKQRIKLQESLVKI